jgi:hypothetical protein
VESVNDRNKHRMIFFTVMPVLGATIRNRYDADCTFRRRINCRRACIFSVKIRASSHILRKTLEYVRHISSITNNSQVALYATETWSVALRED